jgi:hypothetical protein
MRYLTMVVIAAAALVSGCGTINRNPARLEDRTVQPATDASKTFTVIGGMVFYDASPATRGIRFPPGAYTLEAEDADFFYLRSPAPLELRTFKAGQQVDGRNIPGGIMIAKRFSMVLAAGYIEGEGTKKTAIWKLGQEFMRVERKQWTKNF